MGVLSENARLGASAVSDEYRIKGSYQGNYEKGYFKKTYSSAHTAGRYAWSVSFWSRNSSNNMQEIIEGGQGGPWVGISATGEPTFWQDDSNKVIYKEARCEDQGVWTHYLMSCNTNTANDCRVWINGVAIPTDANHKHVTGTVGQWDGFGEASVEMRLCARASASIADIHYISGTMITDPTLFGKIDSTTGVWVPIEYTGSYGDHGFHLAFDDISNGATSLGLDSSPNGNNYTPHEMPFWHNNIEGVDGYLAAHQAYNSGFGSRLQGGWRGASNTTDNWDASDTWAGLSDIGTGAGNSGGKGHNSTEKAMNPVTYADHTWSNGDISAGSGTCKGWVVKMQGCGTVMWKPTASGKMYVGASETHLFSKATEVNISANTWTNLYQGQIFWFFFDSAQQFSAVGQVKKGDFSDWGDDRTQRWCRDSPTAYEEVEGDYRTVRGTVGQLDRRNSDGLSLGYHGQWGRAEQDRQMTYGTFNLTSGKWYFEYKSTKDAGYEQNNQPHIGIAFSQIDNASNYWGLWTRPRSQHDGYANGSNCPGCVYQANGKLRCSDLGTPDGSDVNYGDAWARNDVIGCAIDLDSATRTVRYYLNGNDQGVAWSWTHNSTVVVSCKGDTGVNPILNFGAQSFWNGIPTALETAGYRPMNTFYMNPPIKDPRKHFDIALYTGNGSTQSITGLQFQPDLMWTKGYDSNAAGWVVNDKAMGTGKTWQINSTAEEASDADSVTSFDSSGFSLGADAKMNANGTKYLSACWNFGNTSVTDTTGTLSCTRWTNSTAGQSMIKWTGNGSDPQTIGHGLGSKPKMGIVKILTGGTSGAIMAHYSISGGAWHDTGASGLKMNENEEHISSVNEWNNTSPSDTVVTLGSDFNENGYEYVGYFFIDKEGYQDFGYYHCNSNYNHDQMPRFGFKPALIFIKSDRNFSGSATASDWVTIVPKLGFGDRVPWLYLNENDAYDWRYEDHGWGANTNTNPGEGAPWSYGLYINPSEYQSNDYGKNITKENKKFVYAAWAHQSHKYARGGPVPR